MNSYLLHFVAYTFAMIGFIVMVMFIYKKSVYACSSSKNKEFLKVENSLKLAPTKTVYVIKAGKEKFLIAGDSSNTTMLAKLNSEEEFSIKEFQAEETNIREIPSVKRHIQRISRG
ncbi:flagellar biosynthetic protein FliO [bacterium]|nr:flagellar biosynthetic protein FliO [bacterium]